LNYFIPYLELTLQSLLAPEEVMRRLEVYVRPRRTFAERFTVYSEKPYEGELAQSEFRISRIIGYRNSFLPFSEGKVYPSDSGSKIRLVLRMHPFVNLFALVWFGMLLLFLAFDLFALFAQQTSPASLSPFLIMGGFGFLLFNGSFWFEARKSLAFFKDLFKAA